MHVNILSRRYSLSRGPYARCWKTWILLLSPSAKPEETAFRWQIYQGTAQLNSEKKFRVVVSAIESNAVLRAWDKDSATYFTNAGSFVFPRCGIGAR